MEKDKLHILNFFKLLALIIIASELKVMELLINERTVFEEINILPQVPLICEYLSVSLFIYSVGFLLWNLLEKKIQAKNE